MAATRSKTEYLHRIRLERFLSVWLPNVWLVTLTFHENITDKSEAMRRWKPVADWLKRRDVEWCGVWQQQKRGAWHHHVLVNRYLDAVTLRAFAVERGWGQFVNIRKVGHGSRDFSEPRRVVRYLTRYLTRSFCDHIPRRVRLTSGVLSNKIGTTRFMWVKGWALAWRKGAAIFHRVKLRAPEWRDRNWVLTLGGRELGLLLHCEFFEGFNNSG